MKDGYRIPKAIFSAGKEGGWKFEFPVNPSYGTLFEDEVRNYIEKSNLSPLEKKVKIKEIIDYNNIRETKDLDKLIAKDLKISVGDVRIYRYRARKKIDKKLRQFIENLMSFHKDTKMLKGFKARPVFEDNQAKENEIAFEKAVKQSRLQKRKQRKTNKERDRYIIEGGDSKGR